MRVAQGPEGGGFDSRCLPARASVFRVGLGKLGQPVVPGRGAAAPQRPLRRERVQCILGDVTITGSSKVLALERP